MCYCVCVGEGTEGAGREGISYNLKMRLSWAGSIGELQNFQSYSQN